MSHVMGLKHAGLLNENWAYEDIVATQRKTKQMAFCTSVRCNGNKSNRGKPKPHARGSFCPSCNSALRWSTLTLEQYDLLK